MKIPLTEIDLPEKDLRGEINREALEELADSMAEHGQLQPIGVRRKGDGRYEVVFGARRTRAAILNGWTAIEAALTELDNDSQMASKKLIENVQREALTPLEEGYGILELVGDEEPNYRQLQRQTGKSREWIRSRLELTTLQDELQAALQAGALGIRVAKILSTIENDSIRQQYIEHAIATGMTAEQATFYAHQAEAAASGEVIMQTYDENLMEQRENAPVVHQMWNCFLCREPHQQTNCSMHVICRGCLSTISTARETVTARP